MPVKKLKNHDYIYERITDDGRLTGYQVKIRNKSYPDFIGSFDDLEEAKEAVYQAQLDRTRGFKGDRTSADKATIAGLFKAEIELECAAKTISGARWINLLDGVPFEIIPLALSNNGCPTGSAFYGNDFGLGVEQSVDGTVFSKGL